MQDFLMKVSHGNEILFIFLDVISSIVLVYILLKINQLIFKYLVNKNSLHTKLICNIISLFILLSGFIGIIKKIPGATDLMGTLLAGSGIIAVIVGFAAQESFGNIISGWFISFSRPFEVGDRIKLVDQNLTGYVEDITARHTVVRTFVNSRIIVPNSVMSSAIIENSNYTEERASSFVDVYVKYGTNIELAKSLITKAVLEHPLTIDQRTPEQVENGEPRITVFVRDLSNYGIGLRVSVWTSNVGENFSTCSDIRERILQEFSANDIHIPTVNHIALDFDRV